MAAICFARRNVISILSTISFQSGNKCGGISLKMAWYLELSEAKEDSIVWRRGRTYLVKNSIEKGMNISSMSIRKGCATINVVKSAWSWAQVSHPSKYAIPFLLTTFLEQIFLRQTLVFIKTKWGMELLFSLVHYRVWVHSLCLPQAVHVEFYRFQLIIEQFVRYVVTRMVWKLMLNSNTPQAEEKDQFLNFKILRSQFLVHSRNANNKASSWDNVMSKGFHEARAVIRSFNQ